MAPPRSTESADANKAIFAVYMRHQEKKARALEAYRSSKRLSSVESRRSRSSAHVKRKSSYASDRANRTPNRVTIPSSQSSPSSSSCSSSCSSSPRTPTSLYQELSAHVKGETMDVYIPTGEEAASQDMFFEDAMAYSYPLSNGILTSLNLYPLQGLGTDYVFMKEFEQPGVTTTPNLDSEMEVLFETFINKNAYSDGQSS